MLYDIDDSTGTYTSTNDNTKTSESFTHENVSAARRMYFDYCVDVAIAGDKVRYYMHNDNVVDAHKLEHNKEISSASFTE
jgi:hypothetical protein